MKVDAPMPGERGSRNNLLAEGEGDASTTIHTVARGSRILLDRSEGHTGRVPANSEGAHGVPNPDKSAVASAGAAVSVGSSMAAAQATWASGRISSASAIGWSVCT